MSGVTSSLFENFADHLSAGHIDPRDVDYCIALGKGPLPDLRAKSVRDIMPLRVDKPAIRLTNVTFTPIERPPQLDDYLSVLIGAVTKFSADDVSWPVEPGGKITANFAVVYAVDDNGTLVLLVDWGGELSAWSRERYSKPARFAICWDERVVAELPTEWMPEWRS